MDWWNFQLRICDKCKSSNVELIGYYSILIAIDDAVEIDQYICNDCNNSWDE